jgi:hypothetical protein
LVLAAFAVRNEGARATPISACACHASLCGGDGLIVDLDHRFKLVGLGIAVDLHHRPRFRTVPGAATAASAL